MCVYTKYGCHKVRFITRIAPDWSRSSLKRTIYCFAKYIRLTLYNDHTSYVQVCPCLLLKASLHLVILPLTFLPGTQRGFNTVQHFVQITAAFLLQMNVLTWNKDLTVCCSKVLFILSDQSLGKCWDQILN